MERKECVVAIDLGTSKTVTLVGAKSPGGKVEILSGAVSDSMGGVIRGEIKNAEHTFNALKDTIDKVEGELGIKVKEACVGISGQHVKCSRHSGYIFIENNDGEVKQRDVKRLQDDMNNVQIPVGEAIIDILPQKYAVDGESDIIDPVGVIGKKLEAAFNIITGDRNAITRIDKSLSKLGITVYPQQHILTPLASSEAVLVPDEKELGVALVDIGGGTTEICIWHDNIVRHVAIIPLGGNIINKDIRTYGILERRVESLKVKFGGAVGELERPDKFITIPGLNARDPKEISFRNLAYIIEARMLDIIDCVNNEIKKSGYKGKLGAGIVLTGGCSKLRNIDVLFKNHTDCEVRIAVPEVYVTPESFGMVNDPSYSTAVGLLIKAIGAGATTSVDITATGAADRNSQPAQQTEQKRVVVPPPSAQRPETQKQSVKPEALPVQENNTKHTGEEEEGESPKQKKGLFGRIGDRFTSMFDVIDDEI